MDYARWLIEHPDNGTRSPFYWGVEEGVQGWTADVRWSFKFDTEAAAEKHASDVGIPDYQIRDHKWLDHEPTSNLDVDSC